MPMIKPRGTAPMRCWRWARTPARRGPSPNRAFTIFVGGDGKECVAYVTHLLDPVPTEIHVFTALASGLPVAVGTGEKRS